MAVKIAGDGDDGFFENCRISTILNAKRETAFIIIYFLRAGRLNLLLDSYKHNCFKNDGV